MTVASALAQTPRDLQISELRLGFSGAYKLGCWTQAQVTILGGDEAFTGLVEITVNDSEGVPNTVETPVNRAVAVSPGQPSTARLFVRPGLDGAAMHVRLVDDLVRERAKRSFYPGPDPGGRIRPSGPGIRGRRGERDGDQQDHEQGGRSHEPNEADRLMVRPGLEKRQILSFCRLT